MQTIELQSIYLGKICEALSRLSACESHLKLYKTSNDIYVFESAVLQMRKALESVAFASIAPNKDEYAKLRAKSEVSPDYTKDFNAKKILQLLSNINPDFYPKPISAPIPNGPNAWHFEQRVDNSLTKNKFETFYDRLGKFLHADNPWGNNKNLENLIYDLPKVINAARLLLSYHYTVIRTPNFNGVWIVQAPSDGTTPTILVGQASGDFVVN
jgi:hypothetical protein